MSDIDEVLADYDYAETITREFADGKLSVTLAEANANRNPEWALATWMLMQKHKMENPLTLPEDDRIKVFCATLLKSWNATISGDPVEPKDAPDYLTRNRAGRLLFQEMNGICWKSANFFQVGSSKKKRSSTSTRSGKSLASPRKTSPTRRRRAAKKPPTASKSTSPA